MEQALTNYGELAASPAALLASMEANLGGEKIEPSDLSQIKVPGGGSISWQIDSPTEGEEEAREIEGVILHHRLTRSYWREGIEEGGNSAPDCTSDDCITGVGDPGGACDACPFAQFGSGSNGTGQACTQKRLLFMLRPEEALPSVVVIPPASLRNLKRYLLGLTSKRLRVQGVVSSLTLTKDKNQAGITFARAVPRLKERLDEATTEAMVSFAEQLRPSFERVRVDDNLDLSS